ncbi:di-heme oxidoredictase family protein [Thalassovita sp.]|uniref:di-heme oxidoreductase family protein n=1 Tax=Thalassovita sp. TaxID=1979401 RepID=UPI002B276791|nr:di-heme oxidoredictase family protein [Thalassovita sp.]
MTRFAPHSNPGRPPLWPGLFVLLCLGTTVGAEPSLNPPDLSALPRSVDETARIATVLSPPTDFSAPEPFEDQPAGAATVPYRGGGKAFSHAAKNLENRLDFELGRALFEKLWIASPSSTQASDGLGPLYNTRSCSGCHIGDGRGHAPDGPDDTDVSFVVKLAVPAAPDARMSAITEYLATAPDPAYGSQIQDFATPGHAPEARIRVRYEPRRVDLIDGTADLRMPQLTLDDLAYGSLADTVLISPRVAPPLLGLGLIEAIPAEDILALADPEDRDGDGISGRANIVWSVEYAQPMLGRFGYKAAEPTVRQQAAAAFQTDLGISTPVFPDPWGDCSPAQTDCRMAPHGDADIRGYEADTTALDLLTLYSANLGVPARRDVDDPQVLRGKELFYQAGCPACHRPKFVTHRLPDQPERSFQLIWPYSDFLLHDMGDGLADSRPEARATGREWRTAPLWGVGLAQRVSDRAGFLHDGRARSLLEAILWHGGEAQTAQSQILTLSAEDRHSLILFLESL